MFIYLGFSLNHTVSRVHIQLNIQIYASTPTNIRLDVPKQIASWNIIVTFTTVFFFWCMIRVLHLPGVCWRLYSWVRSCHCWYVGQQSAVSTWLMPKWRHPCCRASSTTPSCCSPTQYTSASAQVRLSCSQDIWHSGCSQWVTISKCFSVASIILMNLQIYGKVSWFRGKGIVVRPQKWTLKEMYSINLISSSMLLFLE